MVAGGQEEVMARLDALIGDVSGDDSKSRRRLHIIERATRLFVEIGYRKTSVEEVASAVGVAKGTLYLYFANKAELMIACLAYEKRSHISRINFLFDDAIAAKTRLVKFIETGMLMAIDMPLSMRLIEGDAEMAAVLADAPSSLTEASRQDRQDLFGPLIREAVAPHEPSEQELRTHSDLLTGVMFFASHLTYPHVRGDLSPQQYARTFAETVVAGVIAKLSPPSEAQNVAATPA